MYLERDTRFGGWGYCAYHDDILVYKWSIRLLVCTILMLIATLRFCLIMFLMIFFIHLLNGFFFLLRLWLVAMSTDDLSKKGARPELVKLNSAFKLVYALTFFNVIYLMQNYYFIFWRDFLFYFMLHRQLWRQCS